MGPHMGLKERVRQALKGLFADWLIGLLNREANKSPDFNNSAKENYISL